MCTLFLSSLRKDFLFEGVINYMKVSDKIWGFIFKYSSHIYLTLGLIIVFMLLSLWDNMSWGNDMSKLRQENRLIRSENDFMLTELGRVGAEMGGQVDVILTQGKIINKQNGYIREAEGIIQSQDILIRRLLKVLNDEEIPEPEPLDPDRITRSGDIFYENYQSN